MLLRVDGAKWWQANLDGRIPGPRGGMIRKLELVKRKIGFHFRVRMRIIVLKEDCPQGVEVHSDSQFLFSEDNKTRKKKRRIRKSIQNELEHYDPLNIEDLDSVAISAQPGRGTIVAVDLLPIVPIPGVEVIRGDFLLDSTTQLIKKSLATGDNPFGKADVILSDMAANLSGNTAHDIQSSLEICGAVFEYAKWNLRSADSIGRKKGGVLL